MIYDYDQYFTITLYHIIILLAFWEYYIKSLSYYSIITDIVWYEKYM